MIGRTICFGILVCGSLLVPRRAEAQAPVRSDSNANVMQAIQQLRADLPGVVKHEVDAAMQSFVTEERLNAEIERLTEILRERGLVFIMLFIANVRLP